MGTLNKIFTGVKDFFKRKDKPKPNIKMINEVNALPEIVKAARPKYKRYRIKGAGKRKPVSLGVSPFKFSRCCSKDWLP